MKTSPSSFPDEMVVRVPAWVWDAKDAWVGENIARRRLGEQALRVALVTAALNGDKEITRDCFFAALRFVEWQERLVNVAGDPETEYLSDGISESIINLLSQLPNLRVIPRTSAFRYKGREADLKTLGRDLNVRTVLTGKLIQRGDRLVVQTELVDVVNDAQLWGRSVQSET